MADQQTLLTLVGLCADEYGEQTIAPLRKGIHKAAACELKKETTEATLHFRQCLNQARTLRDARARVTGGPPPLPHLGEIIKILEEKKGVHRASKFSASLDTSRETEGSEKIITFGQTHRVYVYTPKTTKDQDVLHHAFAGQKVKEAAQFEVGPVYRQCVRCVHAPLGKGKMSAATLFLRLQTVFQVDLNFHNSVVAEESSYGKGHLLFLLQSQLESLSNHPYYSRQSFEIRKSDIHTKWLKKETNKRKTKITNNLKDITPNNSLNDVSFWDGDQSGFRWYDQLFRCLTAYDTAIEQRNPIKEEQISEVLQQISNQFLRNQNSGLASIDLDVYFTAHSTALESLLSRSAVTQWVLEEFSLRYCIGPLYRNVLALSVFAKEITASLHCLVLIHAYCGFCLKFIQDDMNIYNSNELCFFNRTIKIIKRDLITKLLNNIFHHFSIKNQEVLSMTIKLLVLVEECRYNVQIKKDKIKEIPKQFESQIADQIIESLQASTRNFYKECLYTSVAKEFDQHGVNIDRVTPEPPAHAKQAASNTPRQLSNMITTLSSALVDFQSFNFNWLQEDVLGRCQEIIVTTLANDIKFFVRKDLKDYKAFQSLSLVVAYHTFCEDMGLKDQHEVIPPFVPLVITYVEEFEKMMTDRINTVCRDRDSTWVCASPKAPHCLLVENLTEECLAAIQFLRKLKFLQKRAIDSSGLSCSYLKNLSESMVPKLVNSYLICKARIWTAFIECVYNLFIHEFPVEQQASVHDVYLKANFRFTLTGGLESVKMPSSRRFSLFPKKQKIADHVPITRAKSAVLVKKPSSDALASHTTPSKPTYEIEIWKPKVILSKKKVQKYKQTKPKAVISPSMCVKMQTIKYLEGWLSQLYQKEKIRGDEFQEMCEKLISLSTRIFHALVGSIIYAMDFTITSQLESMLEPKKKLGKIFAELLDQEEYILEQLDVVSRFFSDDTFKQFILRLCITIIKSMEGLAFDLPGPRPLPSLILLDQIANHINLFYKKFGVSVELEGLVMDIHTKIEDLNNPEYVSYKRLFDLSKDQIYGKECTLVTPKKRIENVTHSSDSFSTASRSFSISSGEQTRRRHSFDFTKNKYFGAKKEKDSSSSKVSRTISSSISKEEKFDTLTEEIEPPKEQRHSREIKITIKDNRKDEAGENTHRENKDRRDSRDLPKAEDPSKLQGKDPDIKRDDTDESDQNLLIK